MMNPQSYAVRIETKLRAVGYAEYGDADFIRANPMEFMDTVLSHYEKISPADEERATEFWEKYEHLKGQRLDDFGEDTAQEFVTDIVNLF